MKEFDHGDMSHKSYVCSKCGLTGHSKCAGQRQMFPNQDKINGWYISTFVSMKAEPDPARNGQNDLVLRMTIWKEETNKEVIKKFFEYIRSMTQEEVDIAICSLEGHHWAPNGWKYKDEKEFQS